MKINMRLRNITAVFLIGVATAFAGEHHHSDDDHADHETHTKEESAIVAVENEGQRFKLSEESLHFVGVKTQSIRKGLSGNFIVPEGAVIRFYDKVGIYVEDNHWFTLVEIQVKKQTDTLDLQIRSPQLSGHENVVVSGVGVLRAAHLQASGQGGEGHAH